MRKIEEIDELSVGSIIYAPNHINADGSKFRVANVYLKITEIRTIALKDYATNIYFYNVYEADTFKFTHTEHFQEAIVEMKIYKGGWFHPKFNDKSKEAKLLLI